MTTTTTTTFRLASLGRWSPPRAVTVERERAVAFARATNDPIAGHREGRIAAPVFAVVPVFSGLVEAIEAVVPRELVLRGVHGEQDMLLRRPLVPGEIVHVQTAPLGVHRRSSGTLAIIGARTTEPDGTLVNEQWMTFFVRGTQPDEEAGELPPARPAVESVGDTTTVHQRIDADQALRYADASGDRMPIHLDDAAARAVGLPGIIVHGLCTFAFASHALLADAPDRRVERLFARFALPVLPGDELATEISTAPAHDGRRTVAFQTSTSRGLALRDGVAVLAD